MQDTVQLSDLIGGEEAEPPVLDAEDLAALKKLKGYQATKDMVMATVTDKNDIVIACGLGRVLTCAGKAPILRIKAAEVNSGAQDRVKPIELIEALVHLAQTRNFAGVSFSKEMLDIVGAADVSTAAGDAPEPVSRWRFDCRYPRITVAVWAAAMSAWIAYHWFRR